MMLPLPGRFLYFSYILRFIFRSFLDSVPSFTWERKCNLTPMLITTAHWGENLVRTSN